MIKTLEPAAYQGSVHVPPSKSYGHRALIALSLSRGKGVIRNVDLSLDIMATLKCLEDLGVDFLVRDNQVVLDATGFGKARDRVLKPEESGSTLRFFIPITLLFDEVFEFRGKTSLMRRPLSVYEELFDKLDIMLYRDSLESLVVKGRLTPGEFSMRGDISSQFISGMLMVLPLLEGDSVLRVTGDFQSEGYVQMTMKVMEDFGIELERRGNTFHIPGGQSYRVMDYEVEGDYSQGAYFLASGALAGDVEVLGLKPDTFQGDRRIVSILQEMGAGVTSVPGGYRVKKAPLKAVSVDISDIPDLTPVLGVLLSLSEGTGRLQKGDRLRYKESDRVQTTVDLINTLGGEAMTEGNDIIIVGKPTLRGGRVNCQNDHRIVMAAAVASLCCETKVVIEGYEAVNKSYPDFFLDFEPLRQPADPLE